MIASTDTSTIYTDAWLARMPSENVNMSHLNELSKLFYVIFGAYITKSPNAKVGVNSHEMKPFVQSTSVISGMGSIQKRG